MITYLLFSHPGALTMLSGFIGILTPLAMMHNGNGMSGMMMLLCILGIIIALLLIVLLVLLIIYVIKKIRQ